MSTTSTAALKAVGKITTNKWEKPLRLAEKWRAFPVKSESKPTTSIVFLRNLPPSIVPDDIRRIHPESNSNITEIILNGKSNSKFTSSALIRFKSSGDAINFSNEAKSIYVGLRKPKPIMVDESKKHLQPEVIRHPFINYDAGRVILISGMPGKATEKHILNLLQPYNVKLSQDPAIGPIGSSPPILKWQQEKKEIKEMTSYFLIRMISTSEAYWIVRSIHNTYYRKDLYDNLYRIQAKVLW